jgi:4'-phosphopantetheinyl transferase
MRDAHDLQAIVLWQTTIPVADPSYLNQGLALLPGDQRHCILRYRRHSDQLLHLTGRLLVRQYLLQAGQPFLWSDWQESSAGKPFLSNGPCFNISHAGNQVVVAFSQRAVGVDIELEQEVDTASLTRYFHPAEQEFIRAAASPTNAFFTLWTRKEALLKAVGVGIAEQLAAHNCLLPWVSMQHTDWHLHSVPTQAGYFMALATPLPHATWQLVEVPLTHLVLNS